MDAKSQGNIMSCAFAHINDNSHSDMISDDLVARPVCSRLAQLPSFTSSGEKRGRAVALIAMGHCRRATFLERQSRLSPIKAWIGDFSSACSLTARLGMSRYNPTMSLIYSSNVGSFDIFKPFVKCGFKLAFAQMRPTLDGKMHMASAISARLHSVELAGCP